MWNWLKRLLFGRGSKGEVSSPETLSASGRKPSERETDGAVREGSPTSPGSVSDDSFLALLDAPSDPVRLETLGPDDRQFLAGVLRLANEKRLDIPVLPQAALEISRLLAEGDPPIGRYVEVLEGDPGLSVEVLRAANSALYGFRSPAKGVREAVVRLGLQPVRGLLVMAHLRGRVLQAGPFRAKAEQLGDLSLALGRVFRTLASDLGLDPEEAATRGLLFHVEHFVILGALGAVQSGARRPLKPSDEALVEAFRRCGDRVRELAARAWDLPALLPDPELDPRLRAVRRALVRAWAGEAPGEVPGVDAGRLHEALGKVGVG